ncbi:MAG: YbaB/EbfC family nucleoid-associated protein [Planctomycetaceae bacterium]
MFKGLSNIAGLMKQAQEMQGRAAEMKERLAQLRVEGTAGGGMVTVEAAGNLRLLSCRIDPALVAAGDREMLEELVVAAANQALDKAREAELAEMQSLTGGLNIPGLSDTLKDFGMGGNS